MNTFSRILAASLVSVVFIFWQSVALASTSSDDSNYRIVDGVEIYLGFLPQNLITNHTDEHEESKMHGGNKGSNKTVHLIISLYDKKSGNRIEDADVKGYVMEIGRTHQTKTFEAMTINNSVTYGNYFEVPAKDIYDVQLNIQLKSGKEVKAKFSHRHNFD